MRPRFLLDEQLNPEIKKQLQIIEPSIEVYRIGERSVPPRGTLDPDILVWIEQHDFILVTNNRRSMAGHIDDHFAVGGHFPGILQIKEGTTIGRIIFELNLIWDASQAEEYFDIAQYIPL